MHVQFNSLSDYVESLKLITFVVFIFQIIENCKSVLSEKMDNIDLSGVIRNLGLKGLSPEEVHEDTVATLGEGGPSYNMVKKWAPWVVGCLVVVRCVLGSKQLCV